MQAAIEKDVSDGRSVQTEAAFLGHVSLERVFLEHKDQVFRAAYRITGSASDAEDVLQNVFLKLARRELEADDIRNLGSYLHRAGVNAALDVIRLRRNSQNMTLEDAEIKCPFEVSLPAEGEYGALELRRWLRQAMAKLGARSAEMFVLRYLEGRDNREIARMLNTSRATVAVTLHRTRSQLKRDFRAYMEGKQ